MSHSLNMPEHKFELQFMGSHTQASQSILCLLDQPPMVEADLSNALTMLPEETNMKTSWSTEFWS